MLTVRRRRYWMFVIKWVSIAALGLIVFMPKLEAFTSFELDVPFVTTAVAKEAQ